jgi:hypothetical protein
MIEPDFPIACPMDGKKASWKLKSIKEVKN